jgi:putative ABC transport system permease protein
MNADPSAGLIGRAGPPPLTATTILIVVAVAIGVAFAASAVPALRAARTSTVLALADSARSPRRTRWLIAISSRLPVALLLGTRLVARRPRRVLLSGAGIFVTMSGIVAVLGAHTDLNDEKVGDLGLSSRADELNQLLLLITLTLVAMAACNAIFVTWATALDARHASAVSRALGATRNQVSAGLSLSQVLPAVAGALLAIPGGLALLAAVDPDGETPIPPLWELLAVVPATALAVAALTIVPARVVSRRPVAASLAA